MTVKTLRLLVKLFGINALVNRDEYDNSICIEWWFKDDKKLSIDFYPLWYLSSFILYRKISYNSNKYKYTTIELPWLYIYMS